MSLPDIRIQNTGEAQSNVPFTFGQVFKAGDLMQGEGLAGKLSDGSTIPLQVDFKASHGDKSVRHAIVSGVLPSLARGATAKFDLVKAARVSDGFHTWPAVDAKVTLTIAGAVYIAVMPQSWNDQAPWLLGNIVDEMSFDAPVVDKAGAAHPLLTVKFAARLYHATKAVRVEVIVENTKTWQPNADQFTYDVGVNISGKTVFSQKALTHYHHSRWHQYFWTGTTAEIHIQHNTAYLIASRAVSNYEQLTLADYVLPDLGKALTAENTGPMKIGTVIPDMHNAGGRGDIGPLPYFSVAYLLSMDKRAKDVMIANADGSGSWNMHYRDENTGAPIRTDNPVNARITTHWNAIGQGPLPVPRFTETGGAQLYSHDPAHLPSLAYLPYLVTGERFYLEELQFWAATNPLETAPENHAGLGLMRWHQVRGQAWGLRTLGDAAYATPDADPMKQYFVKQVDNNLNFYNQAYVVGNPNNLGAYDGSGENAFQSIYSGNGIMGSSPWQDAYLTWAFGYLVELGFENARPIFEWKSKYATGRLTDPGYCSIQSTAYQLPNLRDGANGKVFSTFGELYKANFGGDTVPNDDGYYGAGPAGVKFIDLPCGSQEQANYLSLTNGGFYWPAGRFVGYSDFVFGYPAMIQPAVALAKTLNAQGAEKAWQVFDARLVKPNYTGNPQWDIIPRTDVTVTPPVEPPAPPVVTPPAPAKKGKITVSSNVALKKMAKLLIQVFNPATRELIRSFDNVTANSKGGFVLEDATLKSKTACAYVVIDAKGKALVINLTTII